MSHQDLKPFRVVIVGHVDHGKSTLVGRLFHDTGSLPDGKKEQIEAQCERRGVPFEWAFLMDALQAERDQNITIDTSQIWFNTDKRPYVIIDAPGHREFLKNMITGAASAEAALLLIAANEGVQEQSRRHGYLLSLLGIKQVTVIVNKMDLVDHSQTVFDEIESEYREFLGQIGLEPREFIPISAREGDNIASKSANTPWYEGSTIVEALDSFEAIAPLNDLPLRLPIQDIYRFDERRILAGRIEAGSLKVGDDLVFLPDRKVGTIKSIERWAAPSQDSAEAGESVGITLTDQIFVERGHVAVHKEQQPPVTNRFRANVFWMGARPLEEGRNYRLKLATQEVDCKVGVIERVIDASSLDMEAGTFVNKDDVAELILETRRPVALDVHSDIETLGRFVLVDGYDVSGGGIVIEPLPLVAEDAEKAADRIVQPQERQLRNGHISGVVRLHGRPGAGRTTIARALDRELFNRGIQAVVVQEADVQAGSLPDVVAALTRAGHVAILDVDSNEDLGFIETTLFGRVFEVALSAPADVCASRTHRSVEGFELPPSTFVTVPTDKIPVKETLGILLEKLLPEIRREWSVVAGNL